MLPHSVDVTDQSFVALAGARVLGVLRRTVAALQRAPGSGAIWTIAMTLALFVNTVSSKGQDVMVFQCEDLRNAGLVLVPSSSPDYQPLLADIQRRIDQPQPGPPIMPEQLRRMMFGKISPDKRSTSAILLNRSDKSIAALALIWRYEETGGRVYTHSFTNTFGKALLLPFPSQASSLKLQAYWNTILPGSKRYLGENEMAGDNTDVRMPDADEIWRGGGGFGGGGGARNPTPPVKSVTLVLDGAFFTDGTFVGPDRLGLWENVTAEAKTRMAIAKVARDGKARGLASAGILDEIGEFTGPPADRSPTPPPPGPITPEDASAASVQRAQQMLAREIESMRQHGGDDRAVDTLASQADTRLPDFRKQ